MKIAVVGTGSIGQRHLANLLQLGITDLVAVSEYSQKDQIGIDGTSIDTVNDLEAVLSSDIDAVVIGNPTSLHLDSLTKSLRANKHVYLEKPAAMNAAGVSEAILEANKQQLVVAMGTMYRFNKRLVELRDRVLKGECGQLISIETVIGEHIADYHPGEDYRQSYTARAELGGGVILTQIHQIDWLNWIFGPFETAYATGLEDSGLDIDVESAVSYMLARKGKATACGQLNYLQRPKRAGLTVTGTKGQLVWDLFEHSLSFTAARLDAEPEIMKTPYDRNEMFSDTMQDFLTCVNSGDQPKASLADGLESLYIADAIKKSIKSGKAEKIYND